MTECINLMERFGDRHKIGFDPAYDAKGRHRNKLDPVYMVIPCRINAEIYPGGGSTLVVEVEGHIYTRKKLKAMNCTTVVQEGDTFLAVAFDVEHFDRIAELVKPRRRPQLSDARRQELRERFEEMWREKKEKEARIDAKTHSGTIA